MAILNPDLRSRCEAIESLLIRKATAFKSFSSSCEGEDLREQEQELRRNMEEASHCFCPGSTDELKHGAALKFSESFDRLRALGAAIKQREVKQRQRFDVLLNELVEDMASIVRESRLIQMEASGQDEDMADAPSFANFAGIGPYSIRDAALIKIEPPAMFGSSGENENHGIQGSENEKTRSKETEAENDAAPATRQKTGRQTRSSSVFELRASSDISTPTTSQQTTSTMAKSIYTDLRFQADSPVQSKGASPASGNFKADAISLNWNKDSPAGSATTTTTTTTRHVSSPASLANIEKRAQENASGTRQPARLPSLAPLRSVNASQHSLSDQDQRLVSGAISIGARYTEQAVHGLPSPQLAQNSQDQTAVAQDGRLQQSQPQPNTKPVSQGGNSTPANTHPGQSQVLSRGLKRPREQLVSPRRRVEYACRKCEVRFQRMEDAELHVRDVCFRGSDCRRILSVIRIVF